MLARCQFGIRDGRCGATLTYPIKGYPWRNNIMRHYEFPLDPATVELLFSEVLRIRSEYPDECLAADQLWNDASERANGITRDRSTGTLCHSVYIVGEDALPTEQYALRENSPALLGSTLFRVISDLIAPYEKIGDRGHSG
jgi:hypothetical protein